MKLTRSELKRGLTLVEVLMVVTVVVVLVGILLPQFARPRVHKGRISCVNNLKQIGLGFRGFSIEQYEKFPWRVDPTNGGSFSNKWFTSSYVYRHFMVISNELGNSPKIVRCANDLSRARVASDFSRILSGTSPNSSSSDPSPQYNQAISYFIGLGAAEEHPQSILSGDRNLSLDFKARKPALLGSTESEPPWIPPPNFANSPQSVTFGFDKSIHRLASNVLMGDGSVQQVENGRTRGIFTSGSPTTESPGGFLFPNNPGLP
jgi:prepilin-type N-terminal cleavage/methylation domain-containing protein